jgi:hypothetical protein
MRTSGSLLLVAALSLAQIASHLGSALAAPITVECCCGEHTADVDCGCPDCLGAVYRSEADADHRGGGQPHLRPCGQETDQLARSPLLVPWALPDAAPPPPDIAIVSVTRTAPLEPPSHIARPPSAPS